MEFMIDMNPYKKTTPMRPFADSLNATHTSLSVQKVNATIFSFGNAGAPRNSLTDKIFIQNYGVEVRPFGLCVHLENQL
jgi:hypothetical protein